MKLVNDILYEPVPETKHGEDLYWLATGMLETMQEHHGMGLAAPQVGESERLIIGADPGAGWSFAIINPVITKESKQTMTVKEACLSFPGETVAMPRHKIVTVEGFDLNWEPVKIRRARGWLGICLQHEVDHLDGHCIITEAQLERR